MNYEKLIQIVSMSEHEIINYLSSFLRNLKSNNVPVTCDDFLYMNNENPVCLVAHIDTLRADDHRVEIIVKDEVMRNRFGIAGFDDRAGVYAVTEIIEHLEMYGHQIPQILFCNHEEKGLLGVTKFIEEGVLNTDGLRMFIEFDRKGKDEFVSYWRDLPVEVECYLQRFGYSKSSGSGSDVAILMQETDIPAVNVSCGYRNEHTPKEYLVLDHLETNINRGIAMCRNPIDQLYSVERSPYMDDLNEFLKRFERM